MDARSLPALRYGTLDGAPEDVIRKTRLFLREYLAPAWADRARRALWVHRAASHGRGDLRADITCDVCCALAVELRVAEGGAS